VANIQDNCTLVANTNQRDTNGDGYGNMCDADLDGSLSVTFTDLVIFSGFFNGTNPEADLDGSGNVTFTDLVIFSGLFNKPPGPSCCGTP
jgi:hypothetical protein